MIRQTSLRDLGFKDGVAFRQLSGETTVYFPVLNSRPIRAGQLMLDVSHGATNNVERYLQVSVGDRIASSTGLPVEGGNLSLLIDIQPQDVSGGFVAVKFAYSGAFSDYICVDERASGDFLQVSPDSGLSLDLNSADISTPREFNSFRPSQVYIQLPESNSQAGLAGAIRGATLFGAETGAVSFVTTPEPVGSQVWETGAIALEVTTSGPASEMEVLNTGPQPELLVRGTDPQLGLWQLSTIWSGLTGAKTSVTQAIDTPSSDANTLSFASLGADLQAQQVISSSQFQIPFQSSDFPAGKTVGGVELVVAAALDPEGHGATASVYLNDVLLGNYPLDKGRPEYLKFAVPSGLVSRDNLLRISIQRQASGGECRFKPQGYPVQVLPGSKLTLIDTDDTGDNFFELRQAFTGGVQVVVGADIEQTYAELMPWLGGVAGSMIPDQAPIIPRNTLADIDASTPFMIVSNANPSDANPLITLDKGRIEIRDRDGNIMFDGEALSRLGIAQIVSRNGVHGLWLRPGEGEAPALSADMPLVLDRGNLALIGAEGVIVATSTSGNSLLEVVYPDQTNWVQILNQYRPWIVGGLWIILTLLVLIVFQKLYRSRRSPPSSEA
ncbi:cellulose biosynthesis cyclic di-GMP-binding regulatory protein BcsB [Falsihalocynthiibacter arcticus]|uniref:cellulose biosynthesis cyclic di-GMP-binding regulatory protein BcsB n=1 Tax=Falsihalocynthiibacter arcticus TaxID=1579316 RepID=UPI00146FED36|nr:cellulose biosynthesis cyclic di-GMP-binding regulatory protein BcsB [Falsihalocynthiibacter arcticus]